MPEDKFFCFGQKAFINKNDEVLVIFDPILGLDFPGGKIQEGELDFDEALKREVREETALEIEVGPPFFRWFIEFPPEHRNYKKDSILIGFKCKYVFGEVKISNEHTKYKWVNKNNFRKLDDGSGYFKALEKYFENS